jgi:hypothetical protein
MAGCYAWHVRFSLALGVAVAVALATPRAHADGDVVASIPSTISDAPPTHHRVVLVSMPDQVFNATASALGPWSIAVESVAELPPGDDVAAAALARAHNASAVAWIDGEELVIYDDLTRRSERRTAPEAVDEVGAATIALSIKTSLRRPVVVAAAPEPPPERPPTEVFAAAPRIEVAVVPERRERPRLHASLRLGASLPLASPSPTLPRISARISHDLPAEPRLALAAAVEGGPTAAIDHPEFTGRYLDLALALGAEWRQALPGKWWLVPSVSGTVHLTRLEGTILMPMPRDKVETSTPFGAEVELSIETGGRLRGGATVYGSFLTGRDRYKVHGDDVLVVPSATLGASLRISFQ